MAATDKYLSFRSKASDGGALLLSTEAVDRRKQARLRHGGALSGGHPEEARPVGRGEIYAPRARPPAAPDHLA